VRYRELPHPGGAVGEPESDQGPINRAERSLRISITACQQGYVSLSSDQLPLCHCRGHEFESGRPRHSFGGVPDVTPATSTSHHFSIEQKSRQQRRAARQIHRWLSFLTVPGAGYKTHNSLLAAQFVFSSNLPDWKTPRPGANAGKGSGSGKVNSPGLSKSLSVPLGRLDQRENSLFCHLSSAKS